MLLRTLFVFVFFLLSHPCVARDGLFLELNSRLNQVTFVEWDNGYPINEESGSLPSQGFALGYQKSNQFYFEYLYSSANSSVDYLGYSQFGSLIETNTEYKLESTQYIFGKTFETTVVFMGYEVNTRDRSILGTEQTVQLDETLKQKQGFVGFKQTVLHTDKYFVDFRFNAKMAFSSFMTVEFEDQFDPSGIHLGVDYTVISNLYVGRVLPKNWMLGVNFIYEFTEIEQSDSVALTQRGLEFGGVFYQPYTEQETISIGLNLSKHF